MLLYVHRNRRLIRYGSPGQPPRLSHSSWALKLFFGQFPSLIQLWQINADNVNFTQTVYLDQKGEAQQINLPPTYLYRWIISFSPFPTVAWLSNSGRTLMVILLTASSSRTWRAWGSVSVYSWNTGHVYNIFNQTVCLTLTKMFCSSVKAMVHFQAWTYVCNTM